MSKIAKTAKNLGADMSDYADVVQAQTLMHGAFPRTRHGTDEAAYRAAYRKLKLRSERRARSIWEATAKIIRSHEMKALERAMLKEARDEHARSTQWINTLEEALRISDEDFHRSQADALRSYYGRDGRPVDSVRKR